MCLIAYSPDGKPITRAVFDAAWMHNPDGVGIMAGHDIARYVGPGAKKRAWRHVKALGAHGRPFAVHWRFGTHGDMSLNNCHPHRTQTGVYVMHNGMMCGFDDRSNLSDTVQFISRHMRDAPDVDDVEFYEWIEMLIGGGNKFLVMDTRGHFHICNERAGEWIGGMWYSNTYSLPWDMQPVRAINWRVFDGLQEAVKLADTNADERDYKEWWANEMAAPGSDLKIKEG